MRLLPLKCKFSVKHRQRRFAARHFYVILRPMSSATALHAAITTAATLTSLLLLAGLLLRPARTH